MSEFVTNNPFKTGISTYTSSIKTFPTVFLYNSELYLIEGTTISVAFYKYNPTSEQWDVDNTFNNFNGAAPPHGTIYTFWDNSELYLLHGDRFSTSLSGWKWNGTQWIGNSAIVAGFTGLNNHSCPTVFYKDSNKYMITGDYGGTFQGWQWNGTQWAANSAIVAGIASEDVGYFSTPNVVNYGEKYYLRCSKNKQWEWDGETSEWIASTFFDNTYTVTPSASTFFESDGVYYLIAGTGGGFTFAYSLKSTAKLSSVSLESDENCNAWMEIALSESLEPGDQLQAYIDNVLVSLTKVDSLTYTADTNYAESDVYNIKCDQIFGGDILDTANATGLFYILPQKNASKINITDANNYRVLDNPQHGFNHGSLFYNGSVYGSARNSQDGNGEADIFKIEAADYSNLQQKTIYLDKFNSLSRIVEFDQIIYCQGFLWTHTNQYLVRINPVDLDYMVFSGLTVIADVGEPPAADDNYIYISGDLTISKLNVSELIGTFASYGYTGSAPVTMPPAAIVNSCVLNKFHDTIYAKPHSITVDNLYLYVNCSTCPWTQWYGYYAAEELNFCHVQKIRKSDMVTVNDIVITKCTDDVVQTGKYIFLAPEQGELLTPEDIGYSWGLIAIDKNTFEIKYLKKLVPNTSSDNIKGDPCYGVFYFNNKIVVQQEESLQTIVLNIDDVERWGDNYPMGAATEDIYEFQLNGIDFSAPCNELNIDNAGYVHTNTWEADTLIFKFTLDQLTDAEKTPEIQTVLISSGADTATVQGEILETGESAMSAVGFRYSTDPENLNINVPATLGTTFEEILSTIPPGIYYIQAWGTNTQGTFYGNTVIFSTYNALKLGYDNDDAILEWINEKYGCSIRCVQDAPGEPDGSTGTATDQNGNTYNTIVINQKRWFTQNLKTENFRNGETIPETIPAASWAALVTAGRCKYE